MSSYLSVLSVFLQTGRHAWEARNVSSRYLHTKHSLHLIDICHCSFHLCVYTSHKYKLCQTKYERERGVFYVWTHVSVHVNACICGDSCAVLWVQVWSKLWSKLTLLMFVSHQVEGYFSL